MTTKTARICAIMSAIAGKLGLIALQIVLHDLPNEILRTIVLAGGTSSAGFQRKNELEILSSVCKRWHSLILPSLYSDIFIIEPDTAVLLSDALISNPALGALVKDLLILPEVMANVIASRFMRVSFPALHTLRLSKAFETPLRLFTHFPFESLCHLEIVGSVLPNFGGAMAEKIETLDLRGFDSTDFAMPIPSFPNTRVLRLGHIVLQAKVIDWILKAVPTCVKLSLYDPRIFRFRPPLAELGKVLQHYGQQLLCLDIYDWTGSIYLSLDLAAVAPNLTYLSVCDLQPSDFLDCLHTLPSKLVKVQLAFEGCVPCNDMLAAFKRFKVPSFLPALSEVPDIMVKGVTDLNEAQLDGYLEAQKQAAVTLKARNLTTGTHMKLAPSIWVEFVRSEDDIQYYEVDQEDDDSDEDEDD